jgi:gamma-glutamylcyclotransferase (GGCT)/AIG2-like uncharacterized protein YtfP
MAKQLAKHGDDRTLTDLLSAPPQQRLFVYGTLMSSAGGGYGQPARTRLMQEAPHRVAAQTRGRLYELGQYPGLVAGAGADDNDDVHGQLLLLPKPLTTLAWLDEYEVISSAPDADNEYVRELRVVTVAGGRSVNAWTYVYIRSTDGLVRLADGRWTASSRQQRTG